MSVELFPLPASCPPPIVTLPMDEALRIEPPTMPEPPMSEPATVMLPNFPAVRRPLKAPSHPRTSPPIFTGPAFAKEITPLLPPSPPRTSPAIVSTPTSFNRSDPLSLPAPPPPQIALDGQRAHAILHIETPRKASGAAQHRAADQHTPGIPAAHGPGDTHNSEVRCKIPRHLERAHAPVT